jgi:hypothetical protein
VVYSSLPLNLCRCQSALLRVVQRFVLLTANPEMVEQDRQLPRHCNDRAFLGVFASALRQLQSPSPEIGVLSKRTQDVLRPLNQDHAQVGVSLPRECICGSLCPEFLLPGCNPT